MIEKITPAGIKDVETTVKNKTTVTAPASTETVNNTSASTQKITAKKYNAIYLRARDTQSNISYMQSRADALQTVNTKLEKLKNLANQYDAVKEKTLAEQDKVVSEAEQVLISIDTMAAKAQFLGSKLIADADSRELGLEVINLESGGAQAQLDKAIRQVAAKIAGNNAQNASAEIKLENLEKTSTLKNGSIPDFQAEQIVDSLVNAMGDTESETLYSKMNTGKISGLIV